MADLKITMADDDVDEPVDAPDPEVEISEEEALAEVEPVNLDDLEDDEALWEDGPTVAQLKAWRDEYEEVYVSIITLPNNNVIWRPLTRQEYRDHVRLMASTTEEMELDDIEANMLSEELIAEKCILFPEFDRKAAKGGLAGVPTLIAQQVMEASGFTSIDVRRLG